MNEDLGQKRKRQPSPRISLDNIVAPMPAQPSLTASRDSLLFVMGSDFRPAKLEKIGELDDRQSRERPHGTVSPQTVQRVTARTSGYASPSTFCSVLVLPATGSGTISVQRDTARTSGYGSQSALVLPASGSDISSHARFRNWRQQPEVLAQS